MTSIDINTTSRDEMQDITSRVSALVPEGMKSGICHLYCVHTTAGLTVNENCDPDVRHDLILKLDELIKWNSAGFKHFEGNSAAHLKASLMGFSQTVPVCDGALVLGRWQGIYFCEFDGPRSRNVMVQFITSES